MTPTIRVHVCFASTAGRCVGVAVLWYVPSLLRENLAHVYLAYLLLPMRLLEDKKTQHDNHSWEKGSLQQTRR
jgi:hypothetical protein